MRTSRLFSPIEHASSKLSMKAKKLHAINLELSPELRPLKGVISNKIRDDQLSHFGSPKNYLTPKNEPKAIV